MALTMSDEQERARRKRLAAPHVLMNGECFCSSCGAIAFKCELDAARAQLAATQAERDEARAALWTAHRATEAAQEATDIEGQSDESALDAYEEGTRAVLRATTPVLARPVGSVEALRAVVTGAQWNEAENRLSLTVGMDRGPWRAALLGEVAIIPGTGLVKDEAARLLEPRSDTPEADKKGAGE